MEFTSSRPDVIRSINQRRLLSHWNHLQGMNRIPVWRGVETEELAAMSASLACVDVVETGDKVRFQSCWRGERIYEAFGSPHRGKFLDEIFPASYREAALATYHQVLATQLPVYTIADLRDCNGRIVHYERLLLPFSHEGSVVDQIIASLETISPEGIFDNRNIMNSASRPPAFALCTIIQH